MQTFLPLTSLESCARVLDRQRLGKQRVEAWQILQTLDPTNPKRGWRNHPAVKMWAGYEPALALYGMNLCREWMSRGYKDTMLDRFVAALRSFEAQGNYPRQPSWWGDDDFHASHRANLLRKDPVWYGQFGWTEDPSLPYVWPVTVSDTPAQAHQLR